MNPEGLQSLCSQENDLQWHRDCGFTFYPKVISSPIVPFSTLRYTLIKNWVPKYITAAGFLFQKSARVNRKKSFLPDVIYGFHFICTVRYAWDENVNSKEPEHTGLSIVGVPGGSQEKGPPEGTSPPTILILTQQRGNSSCKALNHIESRTPHTRYILLLERWCKKQVQTPVNSLAGSESWLETVQSGSERNGQSR